MEKLKCWIHLKGCFYRRCKVQYQDQHPTSILYKINAEAWPSQLSLKFWANTVTLSTFCGSFLNIIACNSSPTRDFLTSLLDSKEQYWMIKKIVLTNGNDLHHLFMTQFEINICDVKTIPNSYIRVITVCHDEVQLPQRLLVTIYSNYLWFVHEASIVGNAKWWWCIGCYQLNCLEHCQVHPRWVGTGL